MAPTTSVYMPVDTALTMMFTRLQQLNSRLTDLTGGSNLRTLAEAVAVVMSANSATGDQLQSDSYLDTATGSALDALGVNNWMVARNPAVQAAGQVTIVRQQTSGALTLQAGWGQLASTPAVAGDQGVAVVTTEDANFADGQASVTVSAQAVLGGQAGNLGAGTYLTPMAPVNSISNQTGYQVTTAFTGGVDAESDDNYRARIPLAVQGRVKGKIPAFLAAALGVPGVQSAGVLTPGKTRGDGSSVPANTVEVYYQGSTGLLAAVQSAVLGAATDTQNATAYAAASLAAPRGQKRVLAQLTVWVAPGADTTTIGQNVQAAVISRVNGVGLGNTVYVSQIVETALSVPGVLSANIPPAQLCLSGGTGAADIPMAGDQYPNLAAADITVTVDTLPA